ncbi:zeta toxin family protein (plasmid) [Moraxella bovis]|uniref:Zeta toxin family protein n=1 Tax=Moraxella bovis TaxID=476 RepID=A0ABY6MBC7_MORBO|nr:zeta toxin family protein [Moraxella bovis]UYZ77093.1 zeta toxin family protein [Moraxella bovis]UYZ79783.1 zeta toxin family protein [Moraxella bovis]UYZ88255.1 zeta toxin family protein [Moraxella bovis]UYZ90999.1 zeta toxin family protein [Moraxella bovis]UYZ99230.1 zeta toxin family protein [Moraxella bovis]
MSANNILEAKSKYAVFNSEIKSIADILVEKGEFVDLVGHEKPKAIILGGQSGSGKRSIVSVVESEFMDKNGVFVADPDRYRVHHPSYNEIQEKFGADSSQITMSFSIKLCDELAKRAIDNRFNIVFDNTSSNFRHFQLRKEQLGKDYDVSFYVMATEYSFSNMRVSLRYEEGGGLKSGRYVPKDIQENSFNGISKTLKDVEDKNLANRIVVFDKYANTIYDSQDGKNGGLTAHEVFTIQRSRDHISAETGKTKLSLDEINDLRQGWQKVQFFMSARNASTNEPNMVSIVNQAIDDLAKKGINVAQIQQPQIGLTYSGKIVAQNHNSILQCRQDGAAFEHKVENVKGLYSQELGNRLQIFYGADGKGDVIKRETEKGIEKQKDLNLSNSNDFSKG